MSDGDIGIVGHVAVEERKILAEIPALETMAEVYARKRHPTITHRAMKTRLALPVIAVTSGLASFLLCDQSQVAG